jgi:phosphomannomutase
MDLIKQTHAVNLAPTHNTHIELIETLIDQLYLTMLTNRFKHDKQLISLVYSPLCGTGAFIIPEALKTMGYTQINLVKEEMASDPEFAKIATPNPETACAMQRSIDLLLKTKSDIALVSDPDADRLGLACLHQGIPICFTGHEIAALILDYLIHTTKDLSSKLVVSSFVTTPLLQVMCQKHLITHIQTLTGFKYISEVINELKTNHTQDRFLMGAEESYGYLVGTHAQDKDAIITSVLLAKAANAAKAKNRTLCDQLMAIYQEYGLFVEQTLTISFSPETTPEQITQKMRPLFIQPPEKLLGEAVMTRINYDTQESVNQDGVTSKITLPKTEAVGFYTAHGWLLIRPSGTEPKLKLYAGLKGTGSTLEEKQKLSKKLSDLLDEFYKNYFK